MDEAYLIQQAKDGDVYAYNTLVLHYQDSVYNVAYRVMGEPDSADLEGTCKRLLKAQQGPFSAERPPTPKAYLEPGADS